MDLKLEHLAFYSTMPRLSIILKVIQAGNSGYHKICWLGLQILPNQVPAAFFAEYFFVVNRHADDFALITDDFASVCTK